MLRHVIEIIKKLQGGHFACSFEWPDGCDGFDLQKCPEMKKLQKLLPYDARCHGCAYGLMDRKKTPIKKPWRILSSCPSIQQMDQKCPGHKTHAQTVGSSRTLRQTENYCIGFVRKLIPALLGLPARGLRLSSRDKERVTLLTDPSPGFADSDLLVAIKTLHSNLGHPSSRALARAIKLSGGTEEAVRCALNFRCTTCARL